MLSRIWNSIGTFNAVPAEIISNTYNQNPQSGFGKAWKFIKLRTNYVLFLGASVIDMTSSAFLTARYALGAAFRADDVQEQRLEQQKKYATLFSKNFIALLVSLPGFWDPGAITNHFVPERKLPGVQAGGNYYHAPDATLVKPKEISELQDIIRQAGREGTKVMPVGAGRSQGRQFLPEGKNAIVVDLEAFNTIQINASKKTAIVGAGVRWADLQIEANKFKLALQVMQASNVFKAGGSIGTNVHGWKHDMGMLSNTILSMTIVDGNGELRTFTPDDKEFHAVTGGLGLVGTVVSVEFQLTDNEPLKEKATLVPNSNYVKHFYENVLPNKNIRMHLFRLSLDPKDLLGSGVAVDYAKEEESAPQVTPNLKAERPRGNREDRILITLARRIDAIRRKWWNGEVDRLLKNNSAATTTNLIMQPPINPLFTPAASEAEWLQEYFLPGANLDQFLKDLGKLLMDNKVPLLNASVRFVKQNNKSPMSYAYDGDRFPVVLCFTQSLHPEKIVQVEKWLREAQHLAVKAGGSFYLPYQHVSAPEDFQAAYKHVDEFLAIKKEMDPNNVFVSGFYQKYMLPQNNNSHIRAILHDKTSRKEFAGFLQNVLQRVDANKLYGLLDDILKYKDTDAEIYQELCRRLPEVLPSTINTVGRVLNSLSTIKHDLAEQAKMLLPGVKEINGLVEIGYPGRFINGFKQSFKVTGKVVAVVDQLSVTDYIQTGFPAPYDQSQKLDYSKPNLAGLADNSADVITCYIGLHHFPEAELDAFLADVRRVLREGGHFLLVDHDVIDEKSLNYAKGAHTFFNAVNGVSLEDEMKEIRNFHPMSYWVQKLEEHGLGYTVTGADVPLIRDGDPSRNRMVCFTKPAPQNVLKQQNAVNDDTLAVTTKPAPKPPLNTDWKKTGNPNASVTTVSVYKESKMEEDLPTQERPSQPMRLGNRQIP